MSDAHEKDKSESMLLEIERLKLQMGRLVSNAESEKETIKRQGEYIRNEIKIVDEKYDKAINGYNGNVGIKIKIDRLEQAKIILNVLAGAVVTIIIYLIIKWITKG